MFPSSNSQFSSGPWTSWREGGRENVLALLNLAWTPRLRSVLCNTGTQIEPDRVFMERKRGTRPEGDAQCWGTFHTASVGDARTVLADQDSQREKDRCSWRGVAMSWRP